MLKNIITFTLIMLSLGTFATKSSIDVLATEHIGKTASVLIHTDFISGHRNFDSSYEITDDGRLEILIDLSEVSMVDIQIGGLVGSLFVEPGHNYNVVFADLPAKKVRTLFNNIIELEFDKKSRDDINLRIAQYNADYEAFFATHFPEIAQSQLRGNSGFVNARRGSLSKSGMIDSAADSVKYSGPSYLELVRQFKTNCENRYKVSRKVSPFFNDYIRYSIATLELSAGAKKQELYDAYLTENVGSVSNPEYCNFLDVFYGNVLEKAMADRTAELLRAVNVKRNAHELDSVFYKTKFMANDEVRQAAILINLRNVYNIKGWNKAAIKSCLASVVEDPDFSGFSAVGQRLSDNIDLGLGKHKVAEFSMIDHLGNEHHLSDFEGKYVYILFATSWCRTCDQELELMKKFYIKYRLKMELIVINLDEQYDEYISWMENQSDKSWLFLYGPSDPLVWDKFDVRSVPEALLIDLNGHVVGDYTRKPSEGLSIDLEKLLNRKSNKPKQKVKVWDD